MMVVALPASVSFGATAHGATNTNSLVKAKAPAPVRIGDLVCEGGDGSSIEQPVIIKNVPFRYGPTARSAEESISRAGQKKAD